MYMSLGIDVPHMTLYKVCTIVDFDLCSTYSMYQLTAKVGIKHQSINQSINL